MGGLLSDASVWPFLRGDLRVLRGQKCDFLVRVGKSVNFRVIDSSTHQAARNFHVRAPRYLPLPKDRSLKFEPFDTSQDAFLVHSRERLRV
jgi:hypothetical protein